MTVCPVAPKRLLGPMGSSNCQVSSAKQSERNHAHQCRIKEIEQFSFRYITILYYEFELPA